MHILLIYGDKWTDIRTERPRWGYCSICHYIQRCRIKYNVQSNVLVTNHMAHTARVVSPHPAKLDKLSKLRDWNSCTQNCALTTTKRRETKDEISHSDKPHNGRNGTFSRNVNRTENHK